MKHFKLCCVTIIHERANEGLNEWMSERSKRHGNCTGRQAISWWWWGLLGRMTVKWEISHYGRKMWKLEREDDRLVGWKEKCNFIFMQIKRRTLQKLCTLLFLWYLSNFFYLIRIRKHTTPNSYVYPFSLNSDRSDCWWRYRTGCWTVVLKSSWWFPVGWICLVFGSDGLSWYYLRISHYGIFPGWQKVRKLNSLIWQISRHRC